MYKLGAGLTRLKYIYGQNLDPNIPENDILFYTQNIILIGSDTLCRLSEYRLIILNLLKPH